MEPEATMFERLCAFVEKQMVAKNVPGVAVGILQGEDVQCAGLGVTNVDHPLPVTDETLFQIGSITKTFTCLAMMRLVERGKLDLQAPVQMYVPEFRVSDEAISKQITLWHLLTHMSGWDGDLFEDTGSGDDALSKYVALMAELEQLALPDEVWSYNNAGFCLSGHIIEQVTGDTYAKAMQDLVFEPLGLERCFFGPGEVITHRFAVGHGVDDGRAKVQRPWPLPRAVYSAGGITCDVRALLAYARFQMGDGTVAGEGEERTTVVTPETMTQMHSPQAPIRGKKHQIGLSWFVDDIDGVRQLSHGGGTVGQVSLLALYPEHKLAVVVLTNADEGGAITDGVRRWVLEHYMDKSDPKPEPIEATEEELAQYIGVYTRPFADVELGMLNGKLVGQMVFKRGFPSRDVPPPPPPAPSSFALCEKDRLLVSAGPSKGSIVDVIRKKDGSIGWIRMGRIYQRKE